MHRSRSQRVARAGAAASLATFVALLSHVAGGGSMPQLFGIVVPWVLSLAVCVVLAGRKLSLVRTSIAVVCSQMLFHLLFVVGAGGTDPEAIPAGHVHGAVALELAGTPAMGTDVTMWMAHGFAAIVTVAALLRGEGAVVALAHIARNLRVWLRRRVHQLSLSALETPRRAPRPIPGNVRAMHLRRMAVSTRRRGPPRALVV